MNNIPSINVGIVAVSRDCFPIELSRERRSRVAAACREMRVPITEIETIVENERDVLAALEEIARKRINALVVYLGNFGPEGPETMLVQRFSGPAMIAAAAEESGDNLVHGRGDAYCGLLSASYNLGLRRQRPHIPEYPVGDPREIAVMIAEFLRSRAWWKGCATSRSSLRPPPFDFLTCHAPIQPLFDLGSRSWSTASWTLRPGAGGGPRPTSSALRAKSSRSSAPGTPIPTWSRSWPGTRARWKRPCGRTWGRAGMSPSPTSAGAFQKYFGHVPCYINSRLAARGIRACEADIYGALSRTCASAPPGAPDCSTSPPGSPGHGRAQPRRHGDYALSDL